MTLLEVQYGIMDLEAEPIPINTVPSLFKRGAQCNQWHSNVTEVFRLLVKLDKLQVQSPLI